MADHVLLADAINYPLLFALGFGAFLLLTLVVTLIEAAVFRLVLRAPIRATFVRLVVANLLSTLAGALVVYFQDPLLDILSLRTIPKRCAHGVLISVLMILAFYLVSLAVEGLAMATRSLATRLRRSRRGILAAVVMANTASYLLAGAVFYGTLSTPTPGALQYLEDTAWTTHADQVVYFIDRKDRFVKRVRLDGQGLTTVVAQPCTSYRLAADGAVIGYRDLGGQWRVPAEAAGPRTEAATQPTSAPSTSDGPVYVPRRTPEHGWWSNDHQATRFVSCDFRFNPQLHVSTGQGELLMPDDFGGLGCPTILSGEDEILLEWWGQLYLLDVEHRRLGLVADGNYYLLLSPQFVESPRAR